MTYQDRKSLIGKSLVLVNPGWLPKWKGRSDAIDFNPLIQFWFKSLLAQM